MFKIGDTVQVIKSEGSYTQADIHQIGVIVNIMHSNYDYEVDFGKEISTITHYGRGHKEKHYRYYKTHQLQLMYDDKVDDISPDEIDILLQESRDS